MPFADVSEIIGKRDLVGEAQQWAQLGLQKKKLALMEEKAQENSKVNNYEFNQAEFGVDNQDHSFLDIHRISYKMTLYISYFPLHLNNGLVQF